MDFTIRQQVTRHSDEVECSSTSSTTATDQTAQRTGEVKAGEADMTHGSRSIAERVDSAEELCPAFFKNVPSAALLRLRLSRLSAAQLIPENVFLYPDCLAPTSPLRAVEIDPFEACNHRCAWCFTEPFRHSASARDEDLAGYLRRFVEQGGVAVHYSGGGEPLLHKAFSRNSDAYDGRTLLEYTCALGLTAGLITNGVLLNELPSLSRLPTLALVRVSLDAADADCHQSRHGCGRSDFARICDALQAILKCRGRNIAPAIGASFIVDPQRRQFVERQELMAMRDVAVGLGLDFVQIKHVHVADADVADEQMGEVAAMVLSSTGRRLNLGYIAIDLPLLHWPAR